MTGAEWLAADDPLFLLGHLQERGSLGARKARLFAVACCRRVWAYLPNDLHREGVEVSARFADGQATEEELNRLSEALWSLYGEPPGAGYLDQPAEMIYLLSYWPLAADWMDAYTGSQQAILLVGHAHRTGQVLRSERWFADDGYWEREAESAMVAERAAQVGLIRDIFGNPFQPTPLAPACVTPATVSLGQATYDAPTLPAGHLDATRLSVVADALEDVGCTNAAILAHLRSPGPHVPGCWPLDLVLAKG
jgi:hypothetical protein